jgi:hypothetical protein
LIGQFGYCELAAPFGLPEHIYALVSGDPGQPSLQRTSPFIARELGVCFQESLLSRVLSGRRLAKERTGNAKHSRAVAAHNLLKRTLVAFARQAYQFKVRSLINLDCQSRS